MIRILLISGCLVIATFGCSKTETSPDRGVAAKQLADGPADTIGLITDSNYETPADALRAFYTAMDSNDLETAKQVSVFLTEDYQEAYFKAMMAPPVATKQFNQALLKAFGDSAKTFPSTGDQLLAKVEAIPVEYTDEETAVWKHQTNKQVSLIKLENGWVIDLRSMEKQAPDPAIFDPMIEIAKHFSETAGKIESGELKTPLDVREALKKF